MKVHTKPAEPHDNQGEIMVAMMTRIANVPEKTPPYETADCPRCGEPCYVDTVNIEQAAKIYKNRMIALCSMCATQGHMNKGTIPLWLAKKNLTPNQALQNLLAAIKQH